MERGSAEKIYKAYFEEGREKNITEIHPYCSDYYKSAALANIYEVPMVLIPDKEDWSVPEFVLEEIFLPPRYKRMLE
ncbi:hypothetical protein H5410_003962 [Solanum commersonii]|uniref:Uncharacterized protein n=1 Tax=Solanum commersonii TaxID=4109 RepID=A0A9J6B634_SOLCO|nr:hypothetical protein H5410_003962 [Solanum commersonii]